MEWIDRLADGLGLEALTGPETARVLDASREVAHRVERKATPLALFLVGMGVARRTAEGEPRELAFGWALDQLISRLPAESPADGADK